MSRNVATKPPVGSPDWFDHWLCRHWSISPQGNYYVTIMGHNVAIIEDHNDPDLWSYRIADKAERETWSSTKYRNPEEAKRPALEECVRILGHR